MPDVAKTMKSPSIPGQFKVTAALQARYLEGWRDGLALQEHPFTTEVAADNFKRLNGIRQLEAYNADYMAGAGGRVEAARKQTGRPRTPPAK